MQSNVYKLFFAVQNSHSTPERERYLSCSWKHQRTFTNPNQRLNKISYFRGKITITLSSAQKIRFLIIKIIDMITSGLPGRARPCFEDGIGKDGPSAFHLHLMITFFIVCSIFWIYFGINHFRIISIEWSQI
jgi:hypothetical protein